MTFLAVKGWEELSDGHKIPLCSPNILVESNSECSNDNKLENQYINVEMAPVEVSKQKELTMFWNELRKKSSCFITKIHFNKSIVDSLFNMRFHKLSVICSSFRRSTKFEITLEKYKVGEHTELQSVVYASDNYGFVLLQLEKDRLRCFYYDFEYSQLISVKYNIVLKHFQRYRFVLRQRSLWIKRLSGFHPTEIDLIRFFPEEGHVWCRYVSVIPFATVPYRDILMTSSLCVISNAYFLSLNQLNSSSRLLTVEKEFKPLRLDSHLDRNIVQSLSICGVFQNKIFYYHRDYDDFIIYVFSVSKDDNIILSKVLPLNLLFESTNFFEKLLFDKIVFFENSNKIIVTCGSSNIVVVDLIYMRVSQVLSYIDCFWNCKLEYHFFDEDLWIVALKPDLYKLKQYLCIKYKLISGLLLKDFAMDAVAKSLSSNQIASLNLPKNLSRHLMSFKSCF